MNQRQYQPGEVVFAEGEESNLVGQILSGEAEVVKAHGDKAVVLGRVRAGEFVGEMGVLEGRARGASVRAASALTLELIDKVDFLRRISEDSEMALQLLVRLSERLNLLDSAYAAATAAGREIAEEAPKDGDAAAGPSLTIDAAPGAAVAGLPGGGLAVERLPFIVGRRPDAGEPSPPGRIGLRLEDALPYRLSRAHFSISRRDGKAVVRDLDSHLGTEVNGVHLGRHFALDAVELKAGDNTVVAGGDGSPFTFKVTVG